MWPYTRTTQETAIHLLDSNLSLLLLKHQQFIFCIQMAELISIGYVESDRIFMQQPKPTSVSENCNQFLFQLKSELNGMKLKDLRSLYNNVLLALPDQNGYVVDHNKLLAALMGSNTNSLFLGSREQSKGALFYIGPYINKK